MPKYYCESGKFQTVLMAPDKEFIVDRFIERAVKNDAHIGFLLKISELGFKSKKFLVCSLVPELRKMGLNLPDDEDIVNLCCKLAGLHPDNITDDVRDWLLNGGIDEE
jgi:hypothetical protein